MPRASTSNFPLSDDDFDELASENELDERDVKPDTGPFAGTIVKPRHVTTSCKSLHDLIHRGTVDLNPSYQRDVVWPQAKMMGLIQSLYLNYYIPPLIFAIDQDITTGEERRTCIDGKQRCTSVVDFMDGKIPFVSPATGKKYWYKKFDTNAKGELCTAAMKNKFDMIQIQAVEYDGIADSIQRDIFQRVQMGVALSAAEKLQAIPGNLTTWIMELAKKYVFEDDTLGEHMDWDVARGKPFQHISSIILMCWFVDSRQTVNSNTLKRWLDKDELPDEGFRKKMDTVLSLLLSIAVDYADTAFTVGETGKKPRIAPVEVWFMGYIIYCRMGSTPLISLAKQIGQMRSAVRKEHKDVFTNSKVVSTCYHFVDKLPVLKPGPNQQVAAIEWEGEDVLDSSAQAKKRKRAAQEEEEDPDYRGPAGGAKSRTNSSSATKTRRAANEAPKAATKPTSSRPAHPTPPPSARPALSGMDAAHPQPRPPQGGQMYSNPYNQPQVQADPRAYNRPNGIYGPPPTQQPTSIHPAALQYNAPRSQQQSQWAHQNNIHPQRRQ